MIVFISNFISEHQIPFCNALFESTNGEFRFIATEPMWEDRKKIGFVDQSDHYPYILKSYENEDNKTLALRLAFEADVVILGAASYKYIDQRVKDGKITFKYTERYFKQSRIKVLDPRILKGRLRQDFQYRNMPYYLLCAGAYVAGDATLIMSYPGKMYKWGYFPKTIRYTDVNTIVDNKDKNSLIWVGRFIDWKHPEVPVEIARILKSRNISFHMTMIGTGPLFNQIQELIKKFELSNYVKLTGALPPEKVRSQMEKSEIFVFSSDRNEGWGVVLNESMNAACVPIANKMIGSVPFLIDNKKNGFIYTKTDISKIADTICLLFQDSKLKKEMSLAAYNTIISEWNAEIAATRLIELSCRLEKGEKVNYSNGICSKAEVM